MLIKPLTELSGVIGNVLYPEGNDGYRAYMFVRIHELHIIVFKS